MKIAVRAPNWLGDVMMATSFFSALRSLNPEADIDIIVPPGFERLPYPIQSQVLVYDKRKSGPSRFGFHLRSRGYDSFYVLPPSFSSAWMAFLAGAKKRIGYQHGLRGMFLTEARHYQKAHRCQTLVEEWLQLLDPSFTAVRFPTALNVDEAWLNFNWPPGVERPNEFVAIAPGAFHGPAKRWSPERMREVVSYLQHKKIHVFVVGSNAEFDVGQFLSQGEKGIINLCGRTTLNQLVAILGRSKGLLSNDSGVSHVMAALKRPQVTIFGSSSPTWTAPDNPQAKIVYIKQPCSPCFKRTCRFGHYDCLNKISVGAVLEAMDAAF